MGDTRMDSPMGHLADLHAESSKQGLRRMMRLASDARTIGAIPRSMTHASSGLMVYPSPSSYPGHTVSSLYSSKPPRPLPTPPVLGPSREICSSPDGRWIVLFHPSLASNGSNMTTGGTLAIYPSDILLPYTTPATVIPHSTLPLPRDPLAITPLYPSKTYGSNGVCPLAGPHVPPSHDPARGPVLVVLMPDGVLLIHPHKLATGDWGMNVLKTSTETRSFVRTGDPSPLNGIEAKGGWMGIVPGNQGVWLAMESQGEIKVVKVDVGTDESGRWYIMTSPMPALPESSLYGEGKELQGVVFTTLSAEQRTMGYPEREETLESERIGMALVSQESHSSVARARIDLVGFERREVVLVDGFGEMTGQIDAPTSWDWFSIPKIINSTLAPLGTTVIELSPLTTTSTDGLCLALLSTPKGVVLRHVAIAAAFTEGEDSWSALRGEEVVLGDMNVDGMLLSQCAMRGGLGLVGVSGGQGTTLVISPCMEGAIGDNLSGLSGRAAKSIVGAVKERVDWSDIVRAVHGSTKQSDMETTVHSILKEVHEAVRDGKHRDEIQQITPVQVALYGLYDSPRRNFAAELGKLAEASRLFTATAKYKDGNVSFDLDTVWDLVFVSEWVYVTMAKIFREVVTERGRLEWGAEQPAALELLYVLNSQPRTLICRLLAQLKAFASFVQILNRPILPPESHFASNSPLTTRNVQAAVMAKDRVKGMSARYGVSIFKWGKALVALHRAKPKVTNEDTTALLQLRVDLTNEELKTLLQPLPAPSSLFTAELSAELYDAVSFMPLPKAVGGQCDRCGWYTLAVIKRAAIIGGEDGLGGWKAERRAGCGCGGTWVRS